MYNHVQLVGIGFTLVTFEAEARVLAIGWVGTSGSVQARISWARIPLLTQRSIITGWADAATRVRVTAQMIATFVIFIISIWFRTKWEPFVLESSRIPQESLSTVSSHHFDAGSKQKLSHLPASRFETRYELMKMSKWKLTWRRW